MAKKKEWREGEMIVTFGLTKIDRHYTSLMSEWVSAELPTFDVYEQANFERIAQKTNKVASWSEEDLKMNRVGGPIY
jgi:hypothetical protein